MALIFLTSLPRCGSTWAAQALAALADARYVHEPFNPTKYPERKSYHMKYLPGGSEDEEFARILGESVRAPDLRSRMRERVQGGTVVLKDVHCCLAVESVHEQLDAIPVILTRHPCAMASSWKALGYRLDSAARLDLLLEQDALVEEHLGPLERHMRSSRDPFFQLGAYWGASYHVLRRIASAHPGWLWLSHEALCADPQSAFPAALRAVGLEVSDPSGRFLEQHDRPLREGESVYATFRETRSVPDQWKERLAPEEARAVLEGAEPFGIEALQQGG
jgi:hypothetical protein